MGLFDIFRRKPAIADSAALSNFIDANAAFLAQKGIYEYSRARAGHYSKVLFQESGFRAAVEESRWRVYPLALAMVAEATDSVLSAQGVGERQKRLDAIIALTLDIFDRYSTTQTLGTETWRELRTELVRRLNLIVLHPPKRAMDIPEPFAMNYFELMPINEKLRGRDFPTTHNYLMVTVCNIHEELTKRLDIPAVEADLRASGGIGSNPN